MKTKLDRRQVFMAYICVAFFLEMAVCTLGVVGFLVGTTVLTFVGLFFLAASSIGKGSTSVSSEVVMGDFRANIPEIYVVGSAAQQIQYLRQEEKNRENRQRR